MEKTLIFYLVIQISLIAYSIESPGVEVIYNVHSVSDNGEHYLVNAEVHSRLDSLGKLFVLRNQTILSPAPTRYLPSFECFGSSSLCEWRSNNTWRSSNVKFQDLKALSLPLDGLNLPCEFNNGSCEFSCNNSPQGPICSCPHGFSLREDGRTCHSDRICHSIIRYDDGSFTSPNYPNNYNVNDNCYWYILTSEEKTIRLVIRNLITESGYDYVKIFDRKNENSQMGIWSGDRKHVDVTSTGNEMLVHFHSDVSNNYRGFEATHSTITGRYSKLKVHELTNENGVISASLNISRFELCISVIYVPHQLNSSSITITAEESTGNKINFRKVYTSKVNEWLINRFVADGNPDVSNNFIGLSVHVTGGRSKILSIVECSSEDVDIYPIPPVIWTNNTLQQHAGSAVLREKTEKKCEHGGTYNSSVSKCICPPGFDGPLCQEACGPNRYGPNCSAECSWFEQGCRNMLFCNLRESCMCAAGFTGADCGRECDPGFYGANCLNFCGECEEGACDIFTGECNSQCKEGFYPPLCQQRYIYLKTAPSLKEASYNNVTVLINFTNTVGVGSPLLYEVQYKEKKNNVWISTPLQEIIDKKSLVTVNLTHLKVGTTYLLRAIIISKDGNSYQGSNIPVLEFETSCQVPDSRMYVMESRNITSSSFIITWKYPKLNDKWCSVTGYQVTLQEKWRKHTKEVSSENTYILKSNLLPGQQYKVHVCAITRNGSAPCSFPFIVTTSAKAPGKVRHLRAEQTDTDVIHISWNRPLLTGGILNGYRVHYECVRHLICEETCTNSSGILTTMENFANLMYLVPHAQYKIRVAAISAIEGPYVSVFATTKTTHPSTSPVASDQSIVSKTNTTVTVQWLPPICPGRNGHLTGYLYMLFSDTESGVIMIQNGTTELLNTTFTALSPMTEYRVHVHAMNSHGWNHKYKLIIAFSTSATVPDAVHDLQIYKTGRRMLGIRWGKPIRTYGTIKSFTVTHQQIGKEQKVVETVPPTPCLGWPHLYCHTISLNLRPDKQYIVTVAAQNTEINQDGTISEIIATTRERAPEAPSQLRVLRSTSSSLELQWGLPNMFNGELRSFLINVEHMEALNESECCEYFPVQELPFREESPFNNLEVTGLIPASTYVVSVSAKTLTMGPSINITCYTAPLPPADLKPPQIMGVASDGYSHIVKIQPFTSHLNTDSLYLLLVLPPGDPSPPVIWSTELSKKISELVKQSFYIVSEFTLEEFTNEMEKKIGTGSELRNGTVGSLKDPKFAPGFYQLGLALVQSYHGSTSVGLSVSNRFKVGTFLNHMEKTTIEAE